MKIRGRSSAGRALDWQSSGHGFKSHRLHQFAGVTQLVEYLVANQIVVGSSPITRLDFKRRKNEI